MTTSRPASDVQPPPRRPSTGRYLAAGLSRRGRRAALGPARTATVVARPLVALAMRPLDRLVPATVDLVLDRLDLTAIVLQRVDLELVVTSALARIDLAGIVEGVIDDVDLPELIRQSTGSMASETVRGARMQGISADEAVGRAVARMLRRRTRSPVPTDPVT